ncbi:MULTISPECIES: hypothetical protein [Pseudomonadaceae]|uniref:hypothetical protein n=1 Tax=Pseudomonadaceae TaxID=135621 RepID=UPI001FCA41BA|nr:MULTISPECIES: hypothetical protein [Pseudomonas]
MFAERYAQEPEKVASIMIMGHLAALFSLSLALALHVWREDRVDAFNSEPEAQ